MPCCASSLSPACGSEETCGSEESRRPAAPGGGKWMPRSGCSGSKWMPRQSLCGGKWAIRPRRAEASGRFSNVFEKMFPYFEKSEGKAGAFRNEMGVLRRNQIFCSLFHVFVSLLLGQKGYKKQKNSKKRPIQYSKRAFPAQKTRKKGIIFS